MTTSLQPHVAKAKHKSATESELKFTLCSTEVAELIQYLNQNFATQPTLQLSNAYFDTAAGDLHQLRIGCRIRRWQLNGQQHAEQTIKLAGRVTNGLHQRPEYNLPQGKQETPNLTSFPTHIWPDSFDIEVVNRALQCMFKVEFQRRCWHYKLSVGELEAGVEVVLDQGFITAGEQSEAVLELEVELQSGPIEALYKVAEMLRSRYKLVEFNKSKAERGFALAFNQVR